MHFVAYRAIPVLYSQGVSDNLGDTCASQKILATLSTIKKHRGWNFAIQKFRCIIGCRYLMPIHNYEGAGKLNTRNNFRVVSQSWIRIIFRGTGCMVHPIWAAKTFNLNDGFRDYWDTDATTVLSRKIRQEHARTPAVTTILFLLQKTTTPFQIVFKVIVVRFVCFASVLTSIWRVLISNVLLKAVVLVPIHFPTSF